MSVRWGLTVVVALFVGGVAHANGSLPNAEVGDGINITNVTLDRIVGENKIRASFVVENSSSQVVRLNSITIWGGDAVITVGDVPIISSLPGLLMRYNEELDFSTSHLMATVESIDVELEELDHIVVEIEINGVKNQITVHRRL